MAAQAEHRESFPSGGAHAVADPVTLEVLEYPAIVKALCRRAATPMGQERLELVAPTADPETVRRLLAETTQMRGLLERGGATAAIPLGVPDVRAALRRCVAGGTLSGPELVQVAEAIEAVAALRGWVAAVAGAEGPAPLLGRWLSRLVDASGVARGIRRAVSADGEVVDSASPELAAIRARLRRLNDRIYEALERLVRSPMGRKALQEPIVTRRAGRYVVPVRQECRDMVPGIVHDASSSGATLFVEPMAVVEANNALRAAQAAEQEEIERILRQLSGEVAGVGEQLVDALEAVGELDAIASRARLAIDQRAVEPAINTEGRVVLQGARHPLLTGEVVPIDVELGRSFWVLVITGPNTGGKTVSLKTVGLLTLMAQSGLHVPAEPGSELAVFERVRADIGDQQSVTESLSTFSSHLRRIVPILQEADDATLVLLDELGAGTDPAEGAALGCAILDHLRAKRARVVVTTHLGDLKVLAHTQPGMANASVSFDLETLRPTYRLVLGAPGQSQALAIAARLGMPEAIVEDARHRLGSQRVRADRIVEELHQALEAARQRLAEATAARAEARALLARAREERDRLRARRQEAIERALEQASQLARQARHEIESLLRQAREAAQSESAAQRVVDLQRLRRELAAARAAWSGGSGGARLPGAGGWGPEAGERAGRADEPAVDAGAMLPVEDPSSLAAGQRVWVLPLQSVGVVVEPPDGQGQATVQVGSVRTRLPVHQLAWLAPPDERGTAAPGGATGATGDRPTGSPGRSASWAKAVTIRPEIDLRGLTAEEARAELDKYLDDCVLAGIERVRVIHGKGTGALRDAVRSYLRESRRIRRFAPAGPAEGGDGVTVAELA
ncbi:endonuclease MutS2 [Geochorda subterranea]|uniref:Endonuclease MutS2 n=1 Tax=Geochorda subterranea TaxID=3109564 RepID=A0ABZ1BST6_9FIRM|nr:Smr/MutS family protein [Limnochorda sp. LNt]WRP15683.1 Smr/MutS family protein [Limnochorda sp. LNt]